MDYILGLAKVEERKVSKEELMKPLDEELPPSAAERPTRSSRGARGRGSRAAGRLTGRAGSDGRAGGTAPRRLFSGRPRAPI